MCGHWALIGDQLGVRLKEELVEHGCRDDQAVVAGEIVARQFEQVQIIARDVEEALDQRAIAVDQTPDQRVHQVGIQHHVHEQLLVLAQRLGHLEEAVGGHGSTGDGIGLVQRLDGG